MVEHKFHNEYGILLCTVSLVLDHFERDDQLFAAQCVWWLATIIRFTEILIYYLHYKVFPSEYVNDLGVSPLTNPGIAGSLIPASEIPV